jgi:hypothetical protein
LDKRSSTGSIQEHLKPVALGFKKYLMDIDDLLFKDVRDDLRQGLHAK